MKKTITILCTLLLIITCISLSSCNAVGVDTGDFECTFDTKNNTATIVAYNGSDTEITIPDSFGKFTVTEIGWGAFSQKYDIVKIILPKELKIIGSAAFEYCVGLEQIVLPENVETIGNTAFYNCRGLKEINIPKNVKSIGLCVFSGCSSIEKFAVDSQCTSYSSDESGALLDKTQKNLIQYPLGGKRKTYTMPETIEEISSYAFEKATNLENVTFSSKLKKIGSYAFSGSSVIEAELPEGLEEIGISAFSETPLINLTLPDGLKTIGEGAFSHCSSIVDVSIPASVSTIGQSAFYMCSAIEAFSVDLESKYFVNDQYGALFNKDMSILICYPVASTIAEYKIPSTVKTISANSFSPSLNLTKVIIPDSVEVIESMAFAYCTNLEDVVYEGIAPGTAPGKIAEDAFKK